MFISIESTSWIRTRPLSQSYPDASRRQGQPVRWLGLVIVLNLLLTTQVATAKTSDSEPAVKMSRSGICHERGTVHYRQTIYFEAFDSMEACRAAGGRRMGGERDANQPQPVYRGTHPPSYYLPYVAGGVIAFAALSVGAAFWWWRRKARQPLRAFEERERRRWEGHKLEPRKPSRH